MSYGVHGCGGGPQATGNGSPIGIRGWRAARWCRLHQRTGPHVRAEGAGDRGNAFQGHVYVRQGRYYRRIVAAMADTVVEAHRNVLFTGGEAAWRLNKAHDPDTNIEGIP